MSTTEDDEPEVTRRGGPFAFWREVQAEGRKVTWATRQEVTVSTIMVLLMGVVAAIFFFAIDGLVHWLIALLLGFSS